MAGEGAGGVGVLGLDSGAGAVLFFGRDSRDRQEPGWFINDDERFVFEQNRDRALGRRVLEDWYRSDLDTANVRFVDRWRIPIFAS